ncbi:alkaline shock response membrane anchor protein AmaP [Mechercharimyces sp. CAU 1602]|uniref:alkaline shock response membrane anchor protein AmaP n=1 Tax=Mechercharimyces sp. CAU 1602 TaxID=2973933 RepID=UPI0021638E29|nr:alkaline shock response membrane anchor protein AmaP [Mechercharimyces sp. CAU 1602]MCS1350782.1 alkaline shock response membrane anchor protein AmaP [Mechercharimyces sp. CAU 1602]
MRIVDRLLTLLLGLLIVGVSLFGIWISMFASFAHIDLELYGDTGKWLVLIISGMLLALSVRLCFVTLRRQKRLTGVEMSLSSGHLHISSATLESLALSAVEQVGGARDLTAKVYVEEHQPTIGILLRLSVDGKSSIPHLAEQMQHQVKSHVEGTAGVVVESIAVYVENTVEKTKSRMRIG